MRSRNPRGSLLLVYLVVLTGSATPAEASLFDRWFEVYREDFQREVAFPLVPEVDEVSGAGVDAQAAPGGPSNPVPVVLPSSVRLEVNGSTSIDHAVFVESTTLAAADFGFRVRFDALDEGVIDESLFVGTRARFLPDVSGVYYVLSLFVQIDPDPPNPPIHTLALTEARYDPLGAPMVTYRMIDVPATPALVAAIGAGTFGLEVSVGRAAGHFEGAVLNADGVLVAGVGPLSLSAFDAQELDRVAAVLDRQDPGNTATVDVTELALFVPTTSEATVALGDDVDANPGDGVCATAGGACTLRAAIQEANAVPGPGRIEVPEGEYSLSLAGIAEDAAASGDLDILDDLEIVGAGHVGVAQSAIDANTLDRVFHIPVSATDAVVRLRHLRITNGLATDVSGAYGGAIASWGRLTLDHVLVTDSVSSIGGGILNGRTLWIHDSIVAGNLAQTTIHDGRGGGIASGSGSLALTNFTDTTIVRSGVVGNEADVGGGGVDVVQADEFVLQDSTVALNVGTQIDSLNSNLTLDHATVFADSGTGIDTTQTPGPGQSIRFVQSVVAGSPACGLTSFPTVLEIYEGHNASSDASCGFSAAGSLENVDPMLTPTDPATSTIAALIPDPDSPLIDAGDPGTACSPTDQAGAPRPLDGDADGSAECDIGAIEVPEPTFGIGLVAGIALSGVFAGRSRDDARDASAGRGRTRIERAIAVAQPKSEGLRRDPAIYRADTRRVA